MREEGIREEGQEERGQQELALLWRGVGKEQRGGGGGIWDGGEGRGGAAAAASATPVPGPRHGQPRRVGGAARPGWWVWVAPVGRNRGVSASERGLRGLSSSAQPRPARSVSACGEGARRRLRGVHGSVRSLVRSPSQRGAGKPPSEAAARGRAGRAQHTSHPDSNV